MGNIRGIFAEQNDIVVTGQIISSNNNQSSLNAALAETNQIRGSNVILQPTGLLASSANIVPNITTTVQGTIGAALSGQGQAGTPSEQPGGGGIPCFIGVTMIKLPHNGSKYIRDVKIDDWVQSFDPDTGELKEGQVSDTFQHRRGGYRLVEFDGGRTTGVDAAGQHKYWTRPDFASIADLPQVFHWSNGWHTQKIVGTRLIKESVIVYNFTVDKWHNYIANGDAVSNLKPIDPLIE